MARRCTDQGAEGISVGPHRAREIDLLRCQVERRVRGVAEKVRKEIPDRALQMDTPSTRQQRVCPHYGGGHIDQAGPSLCGRKHGGGALTQASSTARVENNGVGIRNGGVH